MSQIGSRQTQILERTTKAGDVLSKASAFSPATICHLPINLPNRIGSFLLFDEGFVACTAPTKLPAY